MPQQQAPAKILIISPQPFFEWRGSPIRVSFNLRALTELGCEVDLLCMPIGGDLNLPQVKIYRAANVFQIKQLPIGPSFGKFIYDIILFFKAIGLVVKNKYTVIHGIEEAGLIALILGRLSRAKVIFEKHSDPFSYRGGLLKNIVLHAYSLLEKLMLRSADAVIATGPGLAQQARAVTSNTPIFQISDIPSSLEQAKAETVTRIRADLLQQANEKIIMYVGSFAVYQGIDLLFESIPQVVKANPQARFVIIGGKPSEVTERKSWLSAQGVEKNVTFVGFVPPDELPNYLAAADILLSPRISGVNTPLKVLDYFKAGRAILAVNSQANCLILDQDRALMVETTPTAFAQGVLKLINDDALRAELGKKGQALTQSTYNFDIFKLGLRECYQQFVKLKPVESVETEAARVNLL